LGKNLWQPLGLLQEELPKGVGYKYYRITTQTSWGRDPEWEEQIQMYWNDNLALYEDDQPFCFSRVVYDRNLMEIIFHYLSITFC
jgi:hypothetical protein